MRDFLLEKGWVPKICYRFSIYLAIKDRLKTQNQLFKKSAGQDKIDWVHSLQNSPIALSTEQSNLQHYEVPTEFYQYLLGPRLKYSCCLYDGVSDLAGAEVAMLDLYVERAQIANGQNILDLGCGWGALTLYIAQKFPGAHITAVSHSATQKRYIQAQALDQGLKNVDIITQDVNDLVLADRYDRVVSIEMFEHVRNYARLFAKITKWLHPKGYLFIHHFCHRYLSYPFHARNSWLAKHFFTDGLMPSEDLLLFFNCPLIFQNRWRVNGRHYAKTCYHWLANLYAYKHEILSLFAKHSDHPQREYAQWDIFIRACAQLFAWRMGNEWFVAHYLFQKP